jgi:predicted ATPase/DNA-binding SARP family transcriptional activator
MDYRVLGPLEVRVGDRPCEIGGPKQRTVVAMLVAAWGRPVSIDGMLQALYGDDASPSLRRSLQTYVSNLRQVVGDVIEHRANAYRLVPDDSTLDASQFEASVERAGATLGDDPATAATVLRTALAMWRGPPYADVEAHGRLDGEIARLTEMRLVALEQRFEADLALGHHREVVAEIATMALEHPWRERLQALHMTALYRSGRQTEALRAFEQTRLALADDLGVDPSPELRELEHRILVHDPSLLAPPRAPAVRTEPEPTAEPFHAGVLTFVYTDIEGSTKLLRDLGETYDDVLELHHRIVRGVWERHGGTELSNEGDGFVVAFAAADDALAAAVELQRTLEATTWPSDLPVRVRVGIHSGFARVGATGYSALALHQGARVVGAAHGGQIFVTSETVGRLGRAPPDVELVSLGRFRVRDFDDPVELFTVRGRGLPERSAAPRVRPAERHNIVQPTTALIDRVDERHRLIDSLGPGRVVSLLGPGGVGKTRLAVEVALDVADRWPDGVWLVALADVGRADLVDAAIADALGAPTSGGGSPRARAIAHLSAQHVLLVLDNCEHVTSMVAEFVHDLLSSCPQTAVLVTSRTPLGLRSERVLRVEPLAIRGTTRAGLHEGAVWAPAVELFAERAGGVRDDDLDDVTELCRELDGLPLAIELAAARAHTIPPRDLTARLRRLPTQLESTDPGLPERHRSLARVLDWSLERLDPPQRAMLERLGVCVGGFDLDSVHALCTPGTGGADEGAVIDHLWSLVDGSLVTIDPAAGETRYRLLTTVRRHVVSCADPTELHAGWSRLAEHLRGVLGPDGGLDHRWIARMALEIANVRAVVEHQATPEPLGQALAWAVGKYLDLTDRFRPAVAELQRWESTWSAVTPERVAVLTLIADIHLRLGELGQAGDVLGRAGAMAEQCGSVEWDSTGLVRARADLALRLGDVQDAIDMVEAELQQSHPPRAAARLWDLLGIARGTAGDVEGGVAAFQSELAAAGASGTDTFLSTAHGNLAEAKLQLGDTAGAARHQLISLELARAHHHPVNIAFSMMIAARLVGPDGRYHDAVRLQTVADELLAVAGYELYLEDREVRAEVLAEARRALGADEFDRVCADSRSLSQDEAAELAADVLAGVPTSKEMTPCQSPHPT